ncbi:MAG: InlB B-repeat-containing protein [Clostridiales bacterium]|nr:InlB B-repeat-containing protein [Clostridiales bacterium]
MKGTCKRLMAIFLALVLSLSLISNVPAEAATKRNYVKSLKVSKTSISIKSGKSASLKATVKVKGSASKKNKIKQSAASKKTVKVTVVSTKKGVTKLKITGRTVTKKTKVTFTIKTKGKNKKSKTIKKKITVTVSPATSTATTVTSYTVTFQSNGGTTVSSQKVVKGGTVTEPTAPTRSGYIFLGWYTDAACTNAYDFSTKVTGNLTLYAKWVSENDNLYDDIIDLGDLENLESQGLIEVAYAEDGSVSAIEGSFTDDTVNSAQDAADLLNKSSSLFGDDMEASADDITVQTIESDDSSECFYKYSPEIDDVSVLGSQIVIATDENGEVSGLTSTYDEAIESVDTSADITEDVAQENAVNALLEEDDISTFLNQFVSDDVTEDEVESAFLGELHFSVSKLIYAASDSLTPFLAYAVHITTDEAEEEDVDLTETGTVEETVTLENLVSEDTGEDDTSETLPTIDETYYYYAKDSKYEKHRDI